MRQATDLTKPAPAGTEEYIALSRDFHINGGNWSTEQFWHYFKWKYLHSLILKKTGVDISYDYDQINNLSERLIDLLKILHSFGIKLPLPDQELKDHSRYPDWLQPWFTAAQTWIGDILVPLLITIMTFEPLARAGAQYQKNEHHLNNLYVQLAYKCSDENETHKTQLRLEIKNLSDQSEQLHTYISALLDIHFNRINTFIKEKIKHNHPAHVKSIINYFSHSCVANTTVNLPPIVQQLPPMEIRERVYRPTAMNHVNGAIHIYCGFSALSLGLIFRAQQELSQPDGQRPVFNKIAELFSDKPKITLAKTICEVSISSTTDYFTIYPKNASGFINELKSLLQNNATQMVVRKLAEELNKDKTNWDNLILLDILSLFMRCYNNSPITDVWNAYIYLDKSIRDNIINAVAHIRRIENESREKLVNRSFEMNKPCKQLTSTGFTILISQLLMSLKADTNQAVDHRSIQEVIDKHFNDYSFRELQRAFFYYYDSNKDDEDDFFLKRFNPSVLKSIQETVKDFKKYPETRYIKRTASQYCLTESGLQILRGHLLKDPRFSVAERERLRNISANQTNETAGPGFFSTLFTKATEALSLPATETELAVITAQTPLAPKSSSKPKTSTTSPANRSYGACHPAEAPTTDVSNSKDEIETSVPSNNDGSKYTLLKYYGSQNEIITLAKQLFNVQVMFHNEFEPRHPTLIRAGLPIIHIYNTEILAPTEALHSTYKQILIDPFPKCRTFIHPKIVSFSTAMTSADLSRKEVSTIFNPFTPVKIPFLRDSIFAVTDEYTLLAMAICRQCENAHTSIAKILIYIKDNMPQQGKPPKDFLPKIDYVFYRYYGKSFAEFKADLIVAERKENSEEEEIVSKLSPPQHG